MNLLCDDKDFCKRLVDWGDIIRKTFFDGGVEEVISTRRLVHIVKAYGIWKNKEKAIEVCVNRFDDETKQAFLDLYDKVDADVNFGVKHQLMNLWKNYKSLLYKTFPDLKFESEWACWEGKGTNLTARTYTNPYFIKSREVDIWSDKSCIYNTIIYPKTGSNLPCFGMGFDGIFLKRKLLSYLTFNILKRSICSLCLDYRRQNKTIDFLKWGNHFSENIFVRYCTFADVDEHLDMFKQYLTKYKEMVELERPSGTDTSHYKDFDAYMTKLDPVGGYLAGKFGKEKAESLVHDFLFTYG